MTDSMRRDRDISIFNRNITIKHDDLIRSLVRPCRLQAKHIFSRLLHDRF